MPSSKTKTITYTALFAALSTVLMFISFPLPFFPPFLKLDLSGVPLLIAAFMFGPVPALCATAVKDIINAFFSTSAGVGELADFLMLGSLCAVSGALYRRRHTKRGAVIACCAGTAVIAVVGMFANRFLILPFYGTIMPIEAILAACADVNPLIGDINTYILIGVLPFNLIKGAILSGITFLLYKRLHIFILRDGSGQKARV